MRLRGDETARLLFSLLQVTRFYISKVDIVTSSVSSQYSPNAIVHTP